MSEGTLDGRVVVITGGSRGIGRALALRFATEGAMVVIGARTTSDLEDAVALAPDRMIGVTADSLDPDGARRPVLAALDRLGRADIVINNVGGTAAGTADVYDIPDDAFDATITLNLVSAWWTTSAALPSMRDRGWGRIINIGSGASKRASGALPYTAAKHGLVGLTQQLASVVAKDGITVNCLCPGWTNTSRLDWEAIGRARGTGPDEAKLQAEADSAQGRILEADELTGMAQLLVSDEGAAITGQIISVDGGYKL